jgi:hypothetical protein
MYYRHWRGFIYYINGVFDTIDSLLQHPEYEIELKLKTYNLLIKLIQISKGK